MHKSTVVTHSTSGGVFNFELKTLTCMLKGVNKLSLKWLPQEKCFQLQKKRIYMYLHLLFFLILYLVTPTTEKKVEPLPVADMQWLLCHKSAVE